MLVKMCGECLAVLGRHQARRVHDRTAERAMGGDDCEQFVTSPSVSPAHMSMVPWPRIRCGL